MAQACLWVERKGSAHGSIEGPSFFLVQSSGRETRAGGGVRRSSSWRQRGLRQLDGRGTAALAAHGEATAGRHASVGRRHVPLVVRWAGVARLSSFTARRRRAGTTALAGIPMAWIWRNGAGKILSILSSSRCPSDRVRFGVCSWFAFLIWSRRSADLHQSGP